MYRVLRQWGNSASVCLATLLLIFLVGGTGEANAAFSASTTPAVKSDPQVSICFPAPCDGRYHHHCGRTSHQTQANLHRLPRKFDLEVRPPSVTLRTTPSTLGFRSFEYLSTAGVVTGHSRAPFWAIFAFSQRMLN